MQTSWLSTAEQLTQAVRASPLRLQQLAEAAQADYHAVRRIKLNGAVKQGKNARALCKYFKIGDATPAPPVAITETVLTQAALGAWDGTEAHGVLILELLKCAERFRRSNPE